MSKLSRRSFLQLTAGAGLATAARFRSAVGEIRRASGRPNILWICTDQQRWDTIGALGNNYVHTPNINRLVNEGVAFDHAFCTSPV